MTHFTEHDDGLAIPSSDETSPDVASAHSDHETASMPHLGAPVPKDPLLDCVLHLSKFYHRAASARTLTSDLGLNGDQVSPKHLPSILSKIDLSANKIALKKKAIHQLNLPCIILTKTKGASVLHNVDAENLRVYIPGYSGLSTLSKTEFLTLHTGDAFEVTPSDSSVHTTIYSNTARKNSWFWGVIGELKGEYLKVILASVIVNMLAIAAPLFTLNVYDRVLPNSAFSTLWVLAIGMGIVLISDLVFRTLRGAIIDSTGRWADVKLASRIFHHVLHMKTADKPLRSGEFANRLREFETVREFFSSATIIAIIDIIFVTLFIYVIYAVGGPLAYIPLAAVILVLVFGIIIQPLMMRNVRAVQEEAAQKHGLLIEAIRGLDTIKSLNAEDVFLKRWQGLVAKTAKSTEKVRGYSLSMINFTLVTQQAVTVGLIVAGTYLFDAGELSMGGIIATVMLASRAVAPLGTVAGTLSRLQQSLISLKNLNDIMASDTENSKVALGVSRELTQGSVLFDKVSFAYPNTLSPSLMDISFQIKSGERIGIIGKVGAGKTTLVRLMSGLYDPSEGSISIDGIHISQIHKADLRDALGFVQQDVVLFSGTVRENIAYGVPFATDEEIIRAAELSGAASFINAHPMGYGMPVGENGQFLSGGQRQFISLARVLLRHPKLFLLDEPTSAMDMTSEKLFIERLDQSTKGKTLVISTHRQSLLSIVDKIMIVDQGRVLAYGPKDQVMAFLQSQAKPSEDNSTSSNIAPPRMASETIEGNSI